MSRFVFPPPVLPPERPLLGGMNGTLHEIVEYRPNITEWKVTAGIRALALMIYTLLIRITVNVYSRKQRDDKGQRTVVSTDALTMADDVQHSPVPGSEPSC